MTPAVFYLGVCVVALAVLVWAVWRNELSYLQDVVCLDPTGHLREHRGNESTWRAATHTTGCLCAWCALAPGLCPWCGAPLPTFETEDTR